MTPGVKRLGCEDGEIFILCHYCQERPATTRDHIIPKSIGGPNNRWNLVPACYKCNKRKDVQTYEKFTGCRVLPPGPRSKGFFTTDEFVEKYAIWREASGRPRGRSRNGGTKMAPVHKLYAGHVGS